MEIITWLLAPLAIFCHLPSMVIDSVIDDISQGKGNLANTFLLGLLNYHASSADFSQIHETDMVK